MSETQGEYQAETERLLMGSKIRPKHGYRLYEVRQRVESLLRSEKSLSLNRKAIMELKKQVAQLTQERNKLKKTQVTDDMRTLARLILEHTGTISGPLFQDFKNHENVFSVKYEDGSCHQVKVKFSEIDCE